jgi:DNA-binding winged helix-turn-helix (wHTH) protein/Flp pilus assembly protein TadD
MPRERTGEQPFELGAWRVDPARGVLMRDGKETRLEPKLMDLLLLFAASPGRVIGKDEIVASVWEGRAIGDDTLAAAVSRLRSALDAGSDERHIETLPKRGYRLLVGAKGETAPGRKGGASEVDELVRRGRESSHIPLAPALVQARVYFERAIARDAKRADAHAGLAEVMLAQLMVGQDVPAMLIPAAKAAAQAAVALDENLATAWAALGITTLLADRDFSAADSALLRTIALDPNLATAHQNRAFALCTVGRFVEAEREGRRAVELAPHSLAMRTVLLQTLLLARRYGPAVAEAKRAIGLSAQGAYEAWAVKGWAHHFLGEDDEAVAAFAEHLKAFGSDAATIARITGAYREGGFEACATAAADLFEAQRVLFVPRPLDVAMLRASAGQIDAAFAGLDVAAERGDPILLVAKDLPHLDRLRNDPRFVVLLERIRPVR